MKPPGNVIMRDIGIGQRPASAPPRPSPHGPGIRRADGDEVLTAWWEALEPFAHCIEGTEMKINKDVMDAAFTAYRDHVCAVREGAFSPINAVQPIVTAVAPAIRAAALEEAARVASRATGDDTREALGGNAVIVAMQIEAAIRALAARAQEPRG